METFLLAGSGLTMERNAAAAGLCCNNLNATYDATNTSFGVANFAGATPDYNPFCDDVSWDIRALRGPGVCANDLDCNCNFYSFVFFLAWVLLFISRENVTRVRLGW